MWSAQVATETARVDVQTNAPHSILHALLVLDAPRVPRPSSDDLLPVARFARHGEVFTTPFGLEIVRLVAAGALKDPLLACQRSWRKRQSEIDRTTGGRERTL